MNSLPIPPDLIEKIRAKKCAVFVGAGLSIGAGLPLWGGMIDQMVEWVQSNRPGVITSDRQIELNNCKTDFALAGQVLKGWLNNNDFTTVMKSIFDTDSLTSTMSHKLIAEIPFRAVLTTNYDKLLETAHATKFNRVYTHESNRYHDIRYAFTERQPFILKLHGSIDGISSLVFGRADYERLMKESNEYLKILEEIFSECTVLFLGSSLQDPDLRGLLRNLISATGGAANTHYALINEPRDSDSHTDELIAKPSDNDSDELQIEENQFNEFCDELYEQYHINVLKYSPSSSHHPEVEDFLRRIRQTFSSPPKESEEGLVEEESSLSAANAEMSIQLADIPVRSFINDLLALDDGLLSFNQWQKMTELYTEAVGFESDDQRDAFIEIVANLEEWQEGRGIRLKGAEGVGKTRLALEAIQNNKLEATTIYVSDPACLPRDFFSLVSTMEGIETPITLVIDNSTSEYTREIWRRAKVCREKLQLVFIETAPLLNPSGSNEFVLSELKFERINRIVHSLYKKHGVTVLNDDKRSYAQEHTKGNLKLLIAFVEEFLTHPEVKGVAELVHHEELDHLLKKNLPIDFQVLQTLRGIALIDSINLFSSHITLGEAIAEFVGLEWAEFKYATYYLMEKGLVVKDSERSWPFDGEHVRYIASRLLAVSLSAEVWSVRGDELAEIIISNANKLRAPLLKRLGDLGDRKIAEPVVRRLLYEKENFTDLIADPELFALLGEADPITTITHIEKLLTEVSHEELADWKEYSIITPMLTKSLRLRETCLPAARLIARFAALEGDSNSLDSAKGVWRSIFFIRLGGNPATGEERHRLIARLLHNDHVSMRSLAVTAIHTTLHNLEGDVIRHGFSGYLSPSDWYPKTWEEFWGVRRQVLHLLDEAIDDSDAIIRNDALNVLFMTASDQIPVLFDEIISRLEKYTKSHQLRVANVLKRILSYDSDKLTQDQTNRINTLLNTTISKSYHDRLLLYVVDGNSGSKGRFSNYTDFQTETLQEVQLLVQEAIDAPLLLEPEFDWLAESSVNFPSQVKSFMFSLGEMDSNHFWFEKLRTEIQKNNNWTVLENYLSGRIKAGDTDWVQQQISLLSLTDQKSARAVLEIALRISPNQFGVKVVMDFLSKGWIDVEDIGWRGYWAEQISAEDLQQVLEEINKTRDNTNIISLTLLSAHLRKNPSNDSQFADRALILLREFRGHPHQDFQEWQDWQELVYVYRNAFPVELADATLTVYAHTNVFIYQEREDWKVLETLLKISPKDVWKLITERLLADKDSEDYIGRGYASEFRWIDFTRIVGVKDLMDWVGASYSQASLLAEMINLMGEDLNPIARELLIRYPANEQLHESLYLNFVTPVNQPRVAAYWGGKEDSGRSEKYANLRSKALNWLSNEQQKEVKRWLNWVISNLDEYLHQI